jgi:hypothetical protein
LTDSHGTVRRDVICEVSIKRLEPKWEDILVSALCADATPEAAFEKHVERWLQDFVDETEKTHTDCLRRLAQHRENAQLYVRASAGPIKNETGVSTGLGLQLICAIKLPEDDLKPIEFIADFPRLLCSDYNDPIPSRMEVHLEVPRDDDDMKEKAQASGRLSEDFREDFESDTLPWFRRQCMLHDYCFRNEEVRQRLQNHLKDRAEKHGREIMFLRVQPLQEVIFPKPENISHIATVDIDVTKAGSPEKSFKVRVNHKVQIETTGAAKWLRMLSAAKITDHREWIKERLQKRTEDALLGKSYGDIVVEFDRSDEKSGNVQSGDNSTSVSVDANPRGNRETERDLKTVIQEAVESDLEAAGLSVRMFTTTPDLPVRRLLVEGFRFDTQGSAEDEVFRTSDSRVDFKMAIGVSGSLKSLKQFKSYLADPDVDIVGRLRQKVIQAARDVTTTFSPKQLFLAFDTPIAAGMLSPRKLITEAIDAVLTSKSYADGQAGLDAVCESVVLRPLKGGFDTRWEELTPAQNHGFELAVAGRGSLDDNMHFAVRFLVADIDDQSWANFQNHCAQHTAKQQIDAMIERLKTFGAIKLAAFHADTLRKQKTTDYQEKRSEIFAEAITRISLEMGLKVEVTSILPADSDRIAKLKVLAEAMFDDDIETAKQLHKLLKEAELDPLNIDHEKLIAQKEALDKKFGGAIANIPALPGSSNPLAIGAGDAKADENEEFFGKKKP